MPTQTMSNVTKKSSMQRSNKLLIWLLTSMAVGCTSITGCPFGFSHGVDQEETITLTVYLPPVVSNLDYKDISGFRNQVIVQGGFQHVLSVDGKSHVEKATQSVKPIFDTNTLPDNPIRETATICFEIDRATIDAQEMAKLDSLISRIEKAGLLHIEVEGHTDSNGSARYNKTLSLARAESVKDYLIRHGISQTKVSIMGYGETRPIDENGTEAHRAINRRATLISVRGR
ncbi:MAG: OmpA family protein [Methyloglobulus sp.]|nr:OmpA family protein [Methyloglobulus sp.]